LWAQTARSQIAAALIQSLDQGGICIRWAGTRTAGQVDPAVVAVMYELGIDLTDAFPEPFTDEVIRAADVVITMECADACFLLPDKLNDDRPIDDPRGKAVVTARDICDASRDRVEGLVAGLAVFRAC